MKKSIIAFCLILSTAMCFAQNNTTPGTVTPKADTATYVLIGKISDFQQLYAAITSPDDISKNTLKALAAWIQKIQALPEPKKEAVKPKEEKPKQ